LLTSRGVAICGHPIIAVRIRLGMWESGDLGVILELWKFASP
jgi:hypothetical protein